ncbi:12234_t:CDS:2 [Funneliformis mosseae]|uniref:12234_t:CDS:1 n=1 Tax=Funneliformis mosseae TaxID=27381 RepID=A0A9N9CRJ2_FUNMO|nr:12234_t:CDS:2 [Funneliformis mosseae]
MREEGYFIYWKYVQKLANKRLTSYKECLSLLYHILVCVLFI